MNVDNPANSLPVPHDPHDYTKLHNLAYKIGSKGSKSLHFRLPYCVTVSENDCFFVADCFNHRIQCFDSQGGFLFHFGSYGKDQGCFNEPKDIQFDSKNQRLVIADTLNQRIQIFSLQGQFLFLFGTKGNDNGQFSSPVGIAVDKLRGDIFVSDSDTHSIQVFDEQGNFLRRFGTKGKDYGQLHSPFGMAVLSNGHLAVSEKNNSRISIFNPEEGHFIRAIGEGSLLRPLKIFVDPYDNILVAENGAGRKSLAVYSRDGAELAKISHGQFTNIFCATINKSGKILVCGQGKDSNYHIYVLSH